MNTESKFNAEATYTKSTTQTTIPKNKNPLMDVVITLSIAIALGIGLGGVFTIRVVAQTNNATATTSSDVHSYALNYFSIQNLEYDNIGYKIYEPITLLPPLIEREGQSWERWPSHGTVPCLHGVLNPFFHAMDSSYEEGRPLLLALTRNNYDLITMLETYGLLYLYNEQFVYSYIFEIVYFDNENDPHLWNAYVDMGRVYEYDMGMRYEGWLFTFNIVVNSLTDYYIQNVTARLFLSFDDYPAELRRAQEEHEAFMAALAEKDAEIERIRREEEMAALIVEIMRKFLRFQ